jgi:hypothetical protein
MATMDVSYALCEPTVYTPRCGTHGETTTTVAKVATEIFTCTFLALKLFTAGLLLPPYRLLCRRFTSGSPTYLFAHCFPALVLARSASGMFCDQ